MAPKKKNWNEIQMVITTLSITATIAMWNMYAGDAKAKAVEAEKAVIPPTPTFIPDPTSTPVPAPTQMVYKPIKIIYGGTPPAPEVVQIAVAAPASSKPQKSNKSGGGGGGGGGNTNPAPAPSSGAS